MRAVRHLLPLLALLSSPVSSDWVTDWRSSLRVPTIPDAVADRLASLAAKKKARQEMAQAFAHDLGVRDEQVAFVPARCVEGGFVTLATIDTPSASLLAAGVAPPGTIPFSCDTEANVFWGPDGKGEQNLYLYTTTDASTRTAPTVAFATHRTTSLLGASEQVTAVYFQSHRYTASGTCSTRIKVSKTRNAEGAFNTTIFDECKAQGVNGMTRLVARLVVDRGPVPAVF